MASVDVNSGSPSTSSNGHGGALAPLSQFDPLPVAAWQMGMPSRPEILTAKANPIELLHSLRRRWALAFTLGVLLSGVCAGLVYAFFPVKYEAVAMLHIAAKLPSLVGQSNLNNDS